MPTAIEAVEDLADASRAALAQWQALYDQVVAKQGETVGNVTNIINTFNTRPLSATFFVDPIGGNDANDGASLAAPKRSIDAVLANIGSQGVSIVLLGDDTIRQRHNAATNVYISGAQRAATPSGFINFSRIVSLLGIAENSPSPAVGTYSAGIFFGGGQLFTANISFSLPDVPAGYNTRAHFVSSAFVNMQFLGGTILASGAGAAALVGSFNGGRSVVTFESMTLGTNAAGHVFDGVAAGANPNASWRYSSNLTSA